MYARIALKAVAKMNGVTEQKVRADIEKAIRDAWSSDDPKVIAAQREIPYSGSMPTPEELITYVANKVRTTPSDEF